MPFRPAAVAAFIFLATACTGGSGGPDITVTVSPATTSLAVGQPQQFTATVSGIASQRVIWSVQEGSAGGTISASGLYTAPMLPGDFHVVAASAANVTKTGTATVGVVSPVVVTVSPATPSAAFGGTVQFTAAVSGVTDQTVTWSVQEGNAGGSITAAGLYTAPLLPGNFHVVATSVADTSKTGTAAVLVVSAATCTLPTPQASALPAARVLQLGVHAVGETVTFAVPAGTGSVTILQQGTEPLAAPSVTNLGTLVPNTVVPATISVGGTPYYVQDLKPPDDPASWGTPDGIGSMFFESFAPWTGTFTVPNTSNALEYVVTNGGVPAGTWSIQVFDYAAGCTLPTCVIGDGVSVYPPGKYDLQVLLKPGVVPATGTMDVTFYLVTNTLTASTASTNPSVTRMRQTLGTYLDRAGITLGSVAYVDMPADVKARYAAGVNIDDDLPCGDMATILRMANAGSAMNVFLVNSLVSNQGGTFTYVGVDGTIPGPSSAGGTVASGVLVSVADLTFVTTPTSCQGTVNMVECGADETAYIVAHETGHFLGLYHVSESDGVLFDPVKDTPTCPLSLCAPGAQEVVNSDCTAFPTDPTSPCGGGDNLMFWLMDFARSAGGLSTQQSSIMRANPLVR